ncbi:MAG: homoserine kinase [Chloroflexota bacterium]
MSKVTILTPATVANLGPGFDCLGLALDISLRVEVEESQGLHISYQGEGEVPLNQNNLIYRALVLAYRRLGKTLPGVKIHCQNDIPLARGLGSSAAAAASGLLAANHLLGEPLGGDELLELGAELEGHADNMAAALFGGCQIVIQDRGRLAHSPVKLPRGLKAVLFIPDFEMPTLKSRALLSPQVSREDAVYNLGRVAMLVAALAQGKLELLTLATQDRLHQPARTKLFQAMPVIFKAASEAGALGVCLAGGGSSILALTKVNTSAIAQAMEKMAKAEGVSGRTLITQPNTWGAHRPQE